MTPERWERVRRIFLRVALASPEDRASILDRECAGDGEMRAECDALLAADGAPASFDADPAGEVGLPGLHDCKTSSAVEAPPPEAIGEYRVLRVLGEGGFGVVYLAEQASPKRMVALKTIRPAFTTAEAARRLGREARVLARLDHRGIARVYEAGVARDRSGAGTPYFAMEFVEGLNLIEHCRRAGQSIRERLGMFLQVCDAVAHAHQQGVIHRDLKPANILVGAGGEAKVLDFGVAFLLHPESATLMSLQPSGLLGTLAYMSPESALDERTPPDTRADVYSLGAILYELLSDRPVFDFKETPLHSALRRLQEAEPARLGRIAPTLRGDLEAIVAKAIEKAPGRRYQSVSEFGDDVRRWLRSEPVLARRVSVARRARLWARRKKGLAAGLAAALLLGLAAGGWLVRTEWRLRREHEDARAALEGLLTGVVRELAPLAGTTGRRKDVLKWAEQRVVRMLRERPSDNALREMHATVLCALADVALERFEVSEAHALRMRALGIRESIQPKDAEAWATLSFNLALAADTMRDTGRADVANEMYARALAIDERLASQHPAHPRFLDNLTWSYERRMDSLINAGDLEEAERVARTRLELAARLVDLDPARTLSHHAIWAARAGLSYALSLSGRHAEAYAIYQEMRADAELLVSREPLNRRYRADLVFSLLGIATGLRWEERYEEAVALLDRVVVMTTALAESNESDTLSLGNLAQALNARAELQLFFRREEAARSDAQRALALCSALERLGEVRRARELRRDALERLDVLAGRGEEQVLQSGAR